MKPQRVIVVGASSGIGAELVRQLAARGDIVAAVARRLDRLEALRAEHEGIRVYEHDVTDYSAVPALFQQICHDLGGLDIILYSSGVMTEVGLTEFSFEKDRPMIEVNVLGAIAWLNEAATRFQGVKHGTIVGIGSVAGERGRVGQPVYNTSKSALKTYLEALRNRLSRYGVKVVTIKPGPVQTEMTAHLRLPGAISAQAAAAKIIRKMDKGNEHFLSFTHEIAFWIIRNIPSGLFRRLKI